MGLSDNIEQAINDKRLEAARIRETQLRTRAEEAERQNKETIAQLTELRREFKALTTLGNNVNKPRKVSLKTSGKGNRSTPVLLLSDLHLDEVVTPEEVEGKNAYNREIATARLAKTFKSTVNITKNYWTGIGYDEFVLLLGGDLFSGNIHDELKETNEDTMFGSMLYWAQEFADGIGLLADTFGKVHIASVVGNHGRNTRKPRAKFRARDNFDWYFSMNLAAQFQHDKRITWNVPDSMDATIPVYDKTIRLTHGDQVTGGGGIGGIWPPIMRLIARKRQREHFDYLAFGHWHQIVFGQEFIGNGSLKGYDEYAYGQNFSYEPPAQALWLMAPERGRTWMTPVYSADRKAEKW